MFDSWIIWINGKSWMRISFDFWITKKRIVDENIYDSWIYLNERISFDFWINCSNLYLSFGLVENVGWNVGIVDASGEDMDENTAWFLDTWVEGNFIVEMWSLCRVVAGWRLESLRRLDYGSYETVLRVFWSNFANFARIIVYLILVIIFPRVSSTSLDFYFC